MATFEDTTGWDEEWAAYQRSEEYLAYIRANPEAPPDTLTIDEMLQALSVMMKDEECLEAARQLVDWYDAHPGVSPGENHPTFPYFKFSLLWRFPSWFRMKANLIETRSHEDYHLICDAALNIVRGKYYGPESPEIREDMEAYYVRLKKAVREIQAQRLERQKQREI